MNDSKTILSISKVNKKFSKDIKYNMYYGIRDMISDAIGLRQNYMQLRKKEFWALKNISIDLKQGDILGLVGANGSGKTTLMRIISGIYPLDNGNIEAASNINITPIFALKSGMRQLFTGRENIFIKGAMYGMTKEAISKKIKFITEFSELAEYLDTPYGNYSSGMKARLAFSVAIATEPNVFIIDEALAVGDTGFKEKCYSFLKAYVKEKERAVVFVSNDMEKVRKVANRLIVLTKGTIILDTADIVEGIDFYTKILPNKSKQE